MAKVYAALIMKGLKTIENIPAQLREEVSKLLEVFDPETAGEKRSPGS